MKAITTLSHESWTGIVKVMKQRSYRDHNQQARSANLTNTGQNGWDRANDRREIQLTASYLIAIVADSG